MFLTHAYKSSGHCLLPWLLRFYVWVDPPNEKESLVGQVASITLAIQIPPQKVY